MIHGTIKTKLQALLDENSMTITELEKRAGLKESTVRNIINGKSKSPTIETLYPIAQEFGKPIDFFVNAEDHSPPQYDNIDTFNLKLARSAFEVLAKKFFEQKVQASFPDFLKCVQELYDYSLTSDLNYIDARYANWLVKNKMSRS